MMTLYVSLALACAAAPAESAEIYDLRSGEAVDLKEVAQALSRRDVVFLGEDHDNTEGHELHLKLIEALYRVRPDLTISLEMFERDVQGTLDDYLRGRIDEATFLEHARPWGNYERHYRPVIEFARENGIDVIAANVPRDAARAISKGEEPAPELEPFLPRATASPKGDYWKRFVEAMGGHGGTDDPEAMERYFAAQCLKDDAMAEAISDYLARHPHRRPLVVHLCGKFHSDHGHGTALRLLKRRPLAEIAVVTMEAAEKPEEFDPAEHRLRAHFLLLVRPEPKEEKSEDAEKASDKEKPVPAAGEGKEKKSP